MQRHYDSIEIQILKFIADATAGRKLVTSQQIKLGLPYINSNSVPNSLQRLLDNRLIFCIAKDERSYGFAVTTKGVDALKQAEDKMLKILSKRN
jgi:hypothetical protein